MTSHLLLPGVDLAAFAVALVANLRAGGVVVSADGPATLVQAMRSHRTAVAHRAVLGRPPDVGEQGRGPERVRRGFRRDLRRRVRGATDPTRGPRASSAGCAGTGRRQEVTAAAATATVFRGRRCRARSAPTEFSDDGDQRAGFAAEPTDRACRRAVRSVRRRRSAPHRYLAGADCRRTGRAGGACGGRCTVAAGESMCGSRCERPARRATRWCGWRVPAGASRPRPGRVGVRCQPIDAALCGDLSAPHACDGVAPERHSPRGLRILDIVDTAHACAVASLGGGGPGEGQREGRRPLRRNAPRSVRGRAAGCAARQHAARRSGDHRL